MNYRDYEYFENDKFRTDLLSELSKDNVQGNCNVDVSLQRKFNKALIDNNKKTLIDKEEIILGDFNTAKVLNTLFSSIVNCLFITEY